MKNCAKIIAAAMFLFICAGHAEAYSPSDFTDVFTNPKPMSYCSLSSAINGVAGASGVCAGGLYYYTETISGFREQNNPDEPKILCQKDTPCSPVPTYMLIGGTYHSNNTYDGKVPPLFRVYIPPGITGINMSLYVSPVRVAVVARMGQPPVNPIKPISEYGNIQSVGLSMNSVMNGGDFWTRNGDGNIQIFYGGAIDQTVLQSKGFSDRWLYIQVVNYDAAWLETLTFNMTIGDMTAYRNWYKDVNWDCYNNPGDAAICSTVPSYNVTFSADTSKGTISGTTSQTVRSGNNTTPVTAYAFSDSSNQYKFMNWTGTNGFTTTSSNPLTVPGVASDMTITANFQQQQQQNTRTVSASPADGGTVTPVKQTVIQGENATLIAVAKNPEYTFLNWTGCNNSTANPLTLLNVQSDLTCTANFAPSKKYNITAGTNGLVSIIATNGSVSDDTNKTISGYEGQFVSAIPKSGYRFVGWTNATNTATNPLPLSTSTTTATTITANFEPVAIFSILPSPTAQGGTLLTSTIGNTVTAKPSPDGYSVKWTYPNGTEVPSEWVSSPDGKSKVITVPSQTAYVANFYKTPHKITFGQAVDGTFYVDGKSLTVSDGKAFWEVPDNGSFMVTVIPNTGKSFSKWTKKVVGSADVVYADNPLTVKNIISDMDITPTFGDASGLYTVNFIAGTGGGINGMASQTVPSGTTFTKVVAVANCGYEFSYWQEEPAETPTTVPLNVPYLELVVNKNKTYTAHFMPVVTPNSDGKLGLEEVIYILQVLAGLRP